MVNRRKLLKLSALATASFAAPPAYSASKMPVAHSENPIGSTSQKDQKDSAYDLRQQLAESTAVTIWEFRRFVTLKVDPHDWKTWDWRPAINAAIAYCASVSRGELYFDRKYPVSLDPASPAVAKAYAPGSVAISMSNCPSLHLLGPGGVILMDGEGKANGAIFGNPYETTISGRIVFDIEVDGNAANTIGTVSGILLVGVLNPVFANNCNVHSMTMHGIMCRPNPSQAGMTDTVMEVSSPRVDGCGGIGIQGTRVKDFIHTGSRVSNCADNLIDIYGNDPAGGSSEGYVGKALINRPILDGSPCGIFIESFSDWQITNIDIRNCNRGIKINRINSGAFYGSIKGGCIKGKADGSSGCGVSIKNSSGHVLIDDIEFDHLTDSITCTSGTVGVRVGSRNTHRRIARNIVHHNSSANQLVQSMIEDQYIHEQALTTDGRPQLTPPMTNPKFSGSEFRVFRGTLRSIANNADLGKDFEQSVTVLTSPGSWGGAFSLYNVGGDGETRISANLDDSGIPRYVTISDVAYYLVASGTSGEYFARQWNGSTAVAGNYTANLNSAISVSVKYATFATVGGD